MLKEYQHEHSQGQTNTIYPPLFFLLFLEPGLVAAALMNRALLSANTNEGTLKVT